MHFMAADTMQNGTLLDDRPLVRDEGMASSAVS